MEHQHFNQNVAAEKPATAQETKRQIGGLAVKTVEDEPVCLPDLSDISLADLHRLDIHPTVKESLLRRFLDEEEVVAGWNSAL